jgi:GNAT superfamily N-acetyltransferase
MNRQIRFARREDLARVQRLYQELRPQDPELPPADAAARWEELLRQPHIRIVVADVDGLLTSTCMVAVIPNLGSGGRPFALIENVVTLSEWRGRGLGREVMAYALDFAWSQNCYKAMLLSGAQRIDAHEFYEALGFDGDRERGFVLRRPHDGAGPL